MKQNKFLAPELIFVFAAKTMNLLKRYWVHSGSVINAFIDYLVAKGVDIKDLVLDDNQPEGEGRFKSNSQQRWEDLAAMVQYAKHLSLNLKRSKVDFVEEVIKKKINSIKKEINSVKKYWSSEDSSSH